VAIDRTGEAERLAFVDPKDQAIIPSGNKGLSPPVA
jgi:hypothetical protein